MDYNIILGNSVLTNASDVFSGTLNIKETAYKNNGIYLCKMSASNTTSTPTLNINEIGAKTIANIDGSALIVSVLLVSGWYLFKYDSITDKFLVLNISNSSGTGVVLAKKSGFGDISISTNPTDIAYGTLGAEFTSASSYTIITGSGEYKIEFLLHIMAEGDVSNVLVGVNINGSNPSGSVSTFNTLGFRVTANNTYPLYGVIYKTLINGDIIYPDLSTTYGAVGASLQIDGIQMIVTKVS